MANKQIVQQITATNDFDGTAPVGSPTVDGDVTTFAAEAAGGLVDPGHGSEVTVCCIDLDLGGQTAWTVSIDHGVSETEFASGTGEGSITIGCGISLPVGEKVKITTTGATGALKATMTYDDGL